ncbi:Regulatory protein abaA [Pleurostoma richardsiae]|uniref:Regulatory protein abaA n=1 Tax=Pleurostoma richardsiae TaxID=41990 RepID=A0AA38VHW0_9PEZI|nr:Regulatory protein abaA [Pleurostoma richardsiae]
MELPRSVLPSQRFSPPPDYPYDQSHHDLSSSRQPLTESDGNGQQQHHHHQNVGPLTLCSQASSLTSASPSLRSIPTPPIVPTQSVGSPYNTTGLRLRRQHSQLQKRSKYGVNPIYLSPEFKQYRERQADKSDQKWPDLLEDAFLDALLLIPQMGRRKFSMKKQLYGRNMLISEYLWIAYLRSLPPGAEPNAKEWRRERKQVSSHIQVLKNFFIHHRCYHFFFGKEKDNAPNMGGNKKLKDDVKSESFKTNPVLIALAQDRLPDVRPNYEYFAQLLASDALVAVKPRTCWIYVSNKRIRDDADGNSYHDSEGLIDESVFPHRYNFLNGREDWAGRDKEDRAIRNTLLHEYTWNMKQRESTSVRDISLEWRDTFPELNDALETAAQDSRCDILHMHVTLDLYTVSRLPEGSDLNSMIKITVAQPALQNHRWKVVTRLARPAELCGVAEPTLCKMTNDVGELFQHGPGCDDRNPNCDCMHSRRRGDICRVPFPAQQWATTLSLCAHYPAYPEVRGTGGRRSADAEERKQRAKSASQGPDYGSEYRGRKRAYRPDEDEPEEQPKQAAADGDLTQLDLIRQVGMLQELWSCPRDAHGRQAWTRRAVLVWTFDRCHPYLNAKHETVMLSPGTEWRFLTALDPESPQHQAQMLISGREAVQSPPPSYQQQLGAVMSENFTSAWDTMQTMSQMQGGAGAAGPHHHPRPHHPHHGGMPPGYGPDPISIMDSFSSGLATPPPTAALPPAFPSSFDGSAVGMPAHHHAAHDPHHLGAHNLSFMSATSTVDSNPGALVACGPASADAYLAAADGTSWEAAGLAPDVAAAQHWSTSFNNGNHQANSTLNWQHGTPAESGSGNGDRGGVTGRPSGPPTPSHIPQQHWNAPAADGRNMWAGAAATTPQGWMQSGAGGGWDDGSRTARPLKRSRTDSNLDERVHVRRRMGGPEFVAPPAMMDVKGNVW